MAVRSEKVDVSITGADKGARDLNRMADSADDVADAFGDVAKRADRMADELRRGEATSDRLGDELRRLSVDASVAAARLRGTADAVDDIDDEIGDLGRRGKLSRVVNSAAAAGVEAGAKLGAGLVSGTTGALSGLASNPLVLAAGAAAGVVLAAAIAAPIGAAIAAAILLAIGGGVLIPGIIAAVKSSRIDQLLRGPTELQGAGFGRQGRHRPLELEAVRTAPGVIDKIKEAFGNFGKAFEGPVARAIQTLSDALVRMAPQINLLGATLAPVIDKLAPALAKMAERALPGLIRAAEASIPLFDVLAEHGPAIGDAIGAFANGLADAAPYAAVLLDDFLQLIEVVLPGLGGLLEGLSKLYVINTNGPKAIARSLDPLLSALNKVDAMLNEILRKLGLVRGPQGVVGTVAIQGFGARPRAAGGPVAAGMPYVVGERRPELFVPNVPGTILPRVPTTAPSAGGGYIEVRGESEIVEILRRLVIKHGGGNVQFAFGRR